MDSNLLNISNQSRQHAGQHRLALLLFRLGGKELFAINVFREQELIPYPELTACPWAHPLISDVEMTDMEGYRLTTEIRHDPRLKNLYITLHTALSGVFNNAMVERVGANRFLPKFNADQLARGVPERMRALH